MPAQLAFETQSTWYEAQANRPPIGEPLKEVVETETCIVGAGLAGLYLAKELSERNRPALIVEARRVGLGASGRHGGFCGPGWALEAEKIEKHVGLEQAKTLFDLSLEGFLMVQEVLDSGEALMTPGILHPSTYRNAEDLLKNRDKMAKEYGYEVDYLETDAVRTMLDTSRYYQAYRDPKAFHFDALKLCLTLAEVLQKMGVPVYENSGMKEFHKTSMGWELTTEQGSVRCKQLVFCCGGYGGREFAKLRRAFLPITTSFLVGDFFDVFRQHHPAHPQPSTGALHCQTAGDSENLSNSICPFLRHGWSLYWAEQRDGTALADRFWCICHHHALCGLSTSTPAHRIRAGTNIRG